MSETCPREAFDDLDDGRKVLLAEALADPRAVELGGESGEREGPARGPRLGEAQLDVLEHVGELEERRVVVLDHRLALERAHGRVGRPALHRLQQSAGSEQAKPAFQSATVVGASAYREENTSKMRQVIAQRLTESIGPIPTFYLTVEIEMDSALAVRKQINATVDEADKISVNDIIVKASAMALMKHPFVNSSYQDKTIRFYEQADIGVAVAVDEGLITPVVRGANLKGFGQISKEVRELAGRARERKLQPEEYTGATFSISNLGMFGIKEFTAIINPPEAAIIAVGGATPAAVVRDGAIVVRNMMSVTMSCDHRVVDGATGAKFLQTFKQMLENPALMLM